VGLSAVGRLPTTRTSTATPTPFPYKRHDRVTERSLLPLIEGIARFCSGDRLFTSPTDPRWTADRDLLDDTVSDPWAGQ